VIRYVTAAVLAGTSMSALAGPADYVFLPAVTYGEREIDVKMGSWRKADTGRLSAASIGFGWGVTQNWFTEVYRKYERPQDEGTQFDAWEWENKFQLTESGQYPVDVGFIVELERPEDHAEGYETVFGPLFQTEFGKVQLNGNLLLERHYRAATEQKTEFAYQWQAKYRWLPELEFGAQGFGETGHWSNPDPWSEQSHRWGPAVFGRVALGSHQAIRYNAAWLKGTTLNSPGHTLRAQVEYEF
jgi:hypothetical protein